MLNILVTGASGLIGGELCARLAARGHAVSALVHRRAEVRGNDGRAVPLRGVLSGDVTRLGLGLAEPPPRLDLVIHCAAALAFDAPAAALAAVNIEGTRHAAALARAAGARLLHVSTAYVCGPAEGPVGEAPVAPGARFSNNYEASKAAAEDVVRASGVAHAIARPSIVLGHSATGAIREFPSICNLFRLMARGNISALPVAPGATLDLVPIDFVAEGLVRLAERIERAEGAILHLASGNPVPAAELPRALARFPHFPAARALSPDAFDSSAMAPAERRVLERLLASYGSYLRQDPRFATARFEALTGLACPPTDEAWLDRLIAYGIARGYLPAPPGGQAGTQRTSG